MGLQPIFERFANATVALVLMLGVNGPLVHLEIRCHRHAMYVHWVPLTTSLVTTSTLLQQAHFFASIPLTTMLNSSVTTSTHL